MKVSCSVVFFVLCTSWICAADPIGNPADLEDRVNAMEPITTESAALDLDLEINTPANITAEDIVQALAQESEADNAIEQEVRPTKRPKRPHSNKRPTENKPLHHHSPITMPESWPYFPVPAQIPYPAPCSYPQPIYYPMPVPMYSPYFYPSHSEKNSPTISFDSDESAESGEEVNAEELLRNANFWNNRYANKLAAKNTTATVKPTKRFLIRNWVTNKLNRKTTTTTTTTTKKPEAG